MKFIPSYFLIGYCSLLTATACPWCQRYGIKETVSAGQTDPGGKFYGTEPPAAQTRHYYIAAEATTWTWVPLGKNVAKPLRLPAPLVEHPTATKIRYVEYTDATFTCRVPGAERLGLTGPLLHGLTGDFLVVTFKNLAGLPLSMHPHGVRYDKDSEGAYALPEAGLGAAVGPGATFTYVWQLDAASGPTATGPSSRCWLYHSHCTGDEEINLGLAGFIIVTDPARARADGTPVDVDREMPVLCSIFDETPEDEALEYQDANGNSTLPVPLPLRPYIQTLELQFKMMRPALNGLLYGNLPGLTMRLGERVRWYLGGLGEDNGMHTIHWHGARVREGHEAPTDVLTLLPGETKTADQLADNPGTWMVHCHVSDHMMGGMFANYTVLPAAAPAPPLPFLGMPAARVSLHWQRAEVALDFTPQAEQPALAVLLGSVSVYEGFFPQQCPPTLGLGGRRVKLHTTGPTTASADGITWKVRNASAQGVVLADQMTFEITLTGAPWRDALAAAGLTADGPAEAQLPIQLELNDIKHPSRLTLKVSRADAHLSGVLPLP